MEPPKIQIDVEKKADVTVVNLVGDIDTKTASAVSEKILPLAETEGKIILDLTGVPYMSSAGLRVLLSVYRQVKAKDRKLILVGVSEDIQDTMSVTGFLDFFKLASTIEAGIQALQ